MKKYDYTTSENYIVVDIIWNVTAWHPRTTCRDLLAVYYEGMLITLPLDVFKAETNDRASSEWP